MFNSIRDISSILPLYEGDDGFISEMPSDLVLSNTDKLLNLLPGYYKKILTIDSISFSTHGTVVIDWAVKKNFVSVEIGQTKVGFFMEMADGINRSSDGIPIDVTAAQVITTHLNKLFYRRDVVDSPEMNKLL